MIENETDKDMENILIKMIQVEEILHLWDPDIKIQAVEDEIDGSSFFRSSFFGS